MSSKSCVIISGGDCSGIPEELRGADYVIACDRGWQHAEAMGLTPDLVIGDFDSAPPPETGVSCERAPVRKDDTDTMLAVRRALDLGYRDVTIICAFGGRFDHSLANLQTAAYLAANGARARLIGADTDALAFSGGTEIFPRRDGWSLSVFALSDSCRCVTIRGTKFCCEKETLTNAFPLGVSNVWDAGEAEVSVGSGILMVIQSKLKEGEHI